MRFVKSVVSWQNLLFHELHYFKVYHIQWLKVNERRAKSKEERAKSKEERGKSKDERAKMKENSFPFSLFAFLVNY